MNGKRNARTAVPFIALAILLLVSPACGSGTNPSLVDASATPVDSGSQEQPTQVPAPVEQQNYNVGDVIIGDNILVVLGWENVPATDYITPDTGNKFVAVELLTVNNSQYAMSASTLTFQMSIKDDSGQNYDEDLMASNAIDGSHFYGKLVPGEKLRGKVGFQIPENAQVLQFVFDVSGVDTGKVFVDMGAESVKVEPPAEITGETAQQIYNAGDVIAMGTTTTTVNEVLNPADSLFYPPNAGFKFLLVDLTIENQTATDTIFSTLLQMLVKDSKSQRYEVAFIASGDSDGELAPGEKQRVQVVFQVPTNATGLVFVFDADVWGSGQVFVTLP